MMRVKPAMFLTLLLVQMSLSFDCFLSFTLKNCSMTFSDTVTVMCLNGHLQKIPDDVPLNCEVLDVSSNQITEIKRPDVNRFTQLTVLRFTRNLLLRIEDEAFVKLQKLKTLDLSHNKISNLTQSMFVGLSQLVSLNLFSNRISQIAPNVFQPLSSLTRVILNENLITNLTDTATLFTLPNIKIIFLNTNRFTSINSDHLPFNSSNVTTLSLLSKSLREFILKRDIFPNLSSLNLKAGKFFDWRVNSDAYLNRLTHLSLVKVNLSSLAPSSTALSLYRI
ncbi:hypothetical protein WMY93_002423 [Mugilogobius chulae]|uniref:Uncharacterized protein n=1 Tax=Mugilogobius chulae TaxID=88201 RepID=A0AAW0Q3K4_9GOBI